jgi:hypothetical protein
MVIKSWGPLFALLALFGASLFGLFVEHPEPHNLSQPTVAPNHNSYPSEFATAHNPIQHGEKGEQKSSWIKGLFYKPTDTLLVIFNGLLVLFTGLLYYATAGLFRETAGLHNAADQQALDMKASIAIAKESADAAINGNKLSREAIIADQRPWVSILSPVIESPLTWEEKGARTTMGVTIKNVGKSPAFDIAVRTHQFVSGPDNYNLGAALTKFCAEVREKQLLPTAKGDVLFPDAGLLFARAEVEQGAKNME